MRAGHIFLAGAESMDAADNNPHFPASRGPVRMFDIRSGRELASVEVGYGDAGLLVDDARAGHVFSVNAGSDPAGVNGYTGASVSMLNARTGRLVRTVPIGDDPLSVASDTIAGLLFVADYNGDKVVVIDARTGRLVWTLPLPGPIGVAVDARARRVFVLAGAAQRRVLAADPWRWMPVSLRRALPFIPPPPGLRTVSYPPRIVMFDEGKL